MPTVRHPSRSFPRDIIFLLILLVCQYGGVQSSCPWDASDLVSWGNVNAWSSGVVPGPASEVVIESGKKVLLDRSVDVLSIHIQPNAALVWANVDGIELQSYYILVDGAFHIGSESCRFLKKANIKLKGKAGNPYWVDDDGQKNRKVLMVRAGGTLEIHGMEKTPWTKLAQTIPRWMDLPCPFVYDHGDLVTNVIANERGSGVHVIVWNEDGSVADFSLFDAFATFKSFMTAIPNGKVIGVYAFKYGLDPSLLSPTISRATDINAVMEAMGAQYISQVRLDDSYAFITRKGDLSSTKEHFKQSGLLLANFEPEGFLKLTDWTRKREFQVATSGVTNYGFFRVLNTVVAYPKLELAYDVINWNAGDKIVVASTDYDWRQAEVREIAACSDCSLSQIRVSGGFQYRHYGNITYNVDERAEVGLLSRNILIEGVMEDSCYSNNNPLMEKLCLRYNKDTFGGHVKVLEGHAAAHVQGVELYHMGQQSEIGSYPLHFHTCEAVPGSWFRHNSIHHSFSRCVTIHGTHYAEVSGNVCYDHIGHGYFLEDSVEQNNTITGNLGLGTQHGTLLMSDTDRYKCQEDYGVQIDECDELATYWISHPNNDFSNNVAAGSDAHGFAFQFADLPLGLSYNMMLDMGVNFNTTFKPKHFPIKRFYGNVAHSNHEAGVWMDGKISSGKLGAAENYVPENGVISTQNEYDPKDPPGDPSGQSVWTTMERITAYKNIKKNFWVKAGNVNITHASIADAPQGFAGGTTLTESGSSVEYSVFIGETDNLGGQPMTYTAQNGEKKEFARSYASDPWESVTGASLYQGPTMVKHSYFDRYYTWYWADEWTSTLGKRPVRYGGAVSFKRDNTYPTMTSQYTTDLRFGFCDEDTHVTGVSQPVQAHWLFHGEPYMYDWADLDGTRAAHTMDKDGSLTDYPGVYIVRPHKFFTGPQCLDRPDWHMSVCPHRYIKMEILGYDGSLSASKKVKYPLTIFRDDMPNDPFIMSGEIRREFLLRTHKSYLVQFNNTLEGNKYPNVLKFYGYGVEKQDVVRVGLCVSLDLTEFKVYSDYPVLIDRYSGQWNYSNVNTLAELDADTEQNAIFHDTAKGILFFKIWSKHDRTNDTQRCPSGFCYSLKIVFIDGTKTPVRNCDNYYHTDNYPPPLVYNSPAPAVPHKKSCPNPLPTYEGLGAVRWNEVGKIVQQDYSVTCVKANLTRDLINIRGKITALGATATTCYVESEMAFVDPQSFSSMTRQWCVLRCKGRGYQYAGLSEPKNCTCSNVVSTAAAARDPKQLAKKGCDKQCYGDAAMTCGNYARLEVIRIADLNL